MNLLFGALTYWRF